jgi:hypothetical protein
MFISITVWSVVLNGWEKLSDASGFDDIPRSNTVRLCAAFVEGSSRVTIPFLDVMLGPVEDLMRFMRKSANDLRHMGGRR